jgi:hypothetical protein
MFMAFAIDVNGLLQASWYSPVNPRKPCGSLAKWTRTLRWPVTIGDLQLVHHGPRGSSP